MSNINKKRQNSIQKLNKMINYFGRFPILVIGDTGVGKNHSIKDSIKEKAKEFKTIKYVKAGLAEDTDEYWAKRFKEAHNCYLVINDIEKLTKKSQEILFEILSTHNGMYGLNEKEYIVRLIVTTTFSIAKIRDDRRFLNSKLFDRISQFVVEFPNMEETQRNVYDDFLITWGKFFGSEDDIKNEYPKSNEFKNWLDNITIRLHGNFRDLDKIVINWNLHQSINNKIDEKDILKLVKDDFEKYLHNPSHKIYEDNTFILDEDSDYQTLLEGFRKKVKTWAIALNNNNKIKASKMLKISARTMERWN